MAVERPARSGVVATIGPELAQLVVVGLWASTFVVTKAAFAEITPLAFAFVRFGLMTILSFAVLAARGRSWRIRRADLPRFAAAGLAGYTFYQLGFVLGLERSSPFSSSLLIAMVPLFTLVILAARGERAPARGFIGLAIALIGVVIFLADQWQRGASAKNSVHCSTHARLRSSASSAASSSRRTARLRGQRLNDPNLVAIAR